MVNEIIARFAIKEAINDAAIHIGKLENRKKTEVEKRMLEYIDKIFRDTKYDAYETARQIASKNGVSFGIAQKIVNMTAKYMFISCYDNEQLRKKFTNCHCPMDKTMIKKVIETYRKLITAGEIKKDEEEYFFIMTSNIKTNVLPNGVISLGVILVWMRLSNFKIIHI